MVDGGTSRWPDATPGVGRSIGWSKNCSKNWTKESSLLPLDSVCNAEGVLMDSVSCYVFSSLERECGQEQKHRRGARDRNETEHTLHRIPVHISGKPTQCESQISFLPTCILQLWNQVGISDPVTCRQNQPVSLSQSERFCWSRIR